MAITSTYIMESQLYTQEDESEIIHDNDFFLSHGDELAKRYCIRHGSYLTYVRHLNQDHEGCPECARIEHSIRGRRTSIEGVQGRRAVFGDDFTAMSFYMTTIEAKNQRESSEVFGKVGITRYDVTQRFNTFAVDYKAGIKRKTFKVATGVAYDIESMALAEITEASLNYRPLKKLSGFSECFLNTDSSWEVLEDLLSRVKREMFIKVAMYKPVVIDAADPF